MKHPIAIWHACIEQRSLALLDELLDEQACFHSPIVHRPQPGKALTRAYLAAAMKVLGNESFRYVREIIGERDAALEFTALLGEVEINGVDLIRWNEQGRITDFKVMVRPLKAVNTLHQLMAAQLGAAPPG